MSRWEALQQVCQNLKNAVTCWHANISADRIEAWTVHGNTVLTQLAGILALPLSDEDKKNRLREYLAVRWRFIQKTHVDYTFNPSFPANIACLQVAEALAAETEEAVVHFLMPSVNQVVGIPGGAMTLKEATEEEGKLQLHNFVLSENGTALLDVDAILNYTKEDTARLFGESPEFLLTAQEKKLLCEVSPAAGAYFSMLAKIHRIKKGEKPSFYWMLNKVRKVLHDSSRAGNGNELEADFSKCTDMIVALHAVWRIFQESRERIYLSLAARVFLRYVADQIITYTFEDALLALFASVEGAPLLETERARALQLKRNINFCCTAQLTVSFQQFLANNSDLLNISLPGFEAEFSDGEAVLPSAASLEEMAVAFSNSLLRRMPLLGDDSAVNTRQPFYNAYAHLLCQAHFSPEILHDYSRRMGMRVRENRLILIPAMLSMLAEKDWVYFFSGFSITLSVSWCRLMTDERRFYALKAWIQEIPAEQWGVFFINMAQITEIARSISVEHLLHLFDGFTSEQKWTMLRDAMQPILHHVLYSEEQVESFIRLAYTSLHSQALMELFFRPSIIPWLENPTRVWNLLYSHTASENRFQLLKIILTSLTPDKFILSSKALHALLTCLPRNVWRDFFNLVKPFITSIIKNYSDFLSFFLLLRQTEERETCLAAIRQAKIHLLHEIDIAGLLNLMLTASPQCQQHFVFFYFPYFRKAIDDVITTVATLRSCGERVSERLKYNAIFLMDSVLQYASAERVVSFFDISIEERTLLAKIREIKARPGHDRYDLLKAIELFFREHGKPENNHMIKLLKELLLLVESVSVANPQRFPFSLRAITPPPGVVGARPPRSPRAGGAVAPLTERGRSSLLGLPPRLFLDVTQPAVAHHQVRAGAAGLFPPARTGSPRPHWQP